VPDLASNCRVIVTQLAGNLVEQVHLATILGQDSNDLHSHDNFPFIIPVSLWKSGCLWRANAGPPTNQESPAEAALEDGGALHRGMVALGATAAVQYEKVRLPPAYPFYTPSNDGR